MATQTFKLPLNAADFPLISTEASRSVVIPSADVSGPRSGRSFSGTEVSMDYNIPRIIYGENFLPVHAGVKSISYRQTIPPVVAATDFDQIFALRDAEENVVLFSPAKGKNYTYTEVAGTWAANPIYTSTWTVDSASLDTLATARVTRAYVDGKTFICYSRLRVTNGTTDKDGSIFYWDPALGSLVAQDPQITPGGAELVAGMPSAELGKISCISSSNGYLLIAVGLTVYWALFNGTQFNFAITADGEATGSGSRIPEDIKGPITAIVPVAGGFIIFTNKNAISASYSSSSFENPWIFREITNCGGVEEFEKIAIDHAASAPPPRLIAYTTGGIQAVTLNSAESMHPEVTDFLTGKRMERWDDATKKTITSVTPIEFYTKLTYIGNRYLIVSYGMYPGRFSFALLYDSALQRWGKFRIAHTDCFPFLYNKGIYPITYGMLLDVRYDELMDTNYDELYVQATGVTYPRQAVGFLLDTGEVKLAVMDATEQAADDTSKALIVLGRLQLSRSAMFTVFRAEFEGAGSDAQAYLVPSYDGRNLADPLAGVVLERTGDYLLSGWDMATAKNFNLVLEGSFDLSTVTLEGMPDGRI